MSVFIEKLIQKSTDNVWQLLIDNIPAYTQSRTKFLNFTCPVCNDYKKRCGISRSTYIGINCYNCGFSTRYTPGKSLTPKLQQFLTCCNVSNEQIARLKHTCLRIRRELEEISNIPNSVVTFGYLPEFNTTELPNGAKPLQWWVDQQCSDSDFLDVWEYCLGRGKVVMDTANFHWTPLPNFSRRAIMPFYYNDRIVGYTSRAIDKSIAKYLNENQANYLYNNHVMNNDSKYLFIVEGPTDALAINAISPLGSKLNNQQINWIKSTGKTPVVIPDRDKSGIKLINIARKNEFSVSFPCLGNHYKDWWSSDVNDCDHAVKKYGRLYTIRSIVENITNNNTEIEMKKKYFKDN